MPKNQNLSDLATRLIEVDIGIYKIYNLLFQSYDDNNLHKKQLEYLKIALDVENNIYTEIGDKLLTSKNFAQAEENVFNEIYFRIYNFIESKIFYYPFCEDRYSAQSNLEININTIERQIMFDVDLLSYYNLLQIMEKDMYDGLLPFFNDAKFTLLFRCKYFDNLAFEDLQDIKIESRERLLAFNHDKDLIASKFREIIFEGLKEYSQNALQYDNSKKTIENLADAVINLIQIETYLELTSKEEAFEIFFTYFKTLEENIQLKNLLEKSNINSKIRDLIKYNFINKSDNKILSKSKS